jgi:hypothetical protein
MNDTEIDVKLFSTRLDMIERELLFYIKRSR